MTSNQIAYQNLIETKLHNRNTEFETNRNNVAVLAETNRHNMVTEFEQNRHNVADESIRMQANVINQQHYQRMDAETKRHNTVVENETNRSNLVNESIKKESNAIGWANVGVAQQEADISQQNADTNVMNANTKRAEYWTNKTKVEFEEDRSKTQNRNDTISTFTNAFKIMTDSLMNPFTQMGKMVTLFK